MKAAVSCHLAPQIICMAVGQSAADFAHVIHVLVLVSEKPAGPTQA